MLLKRILSGIYWTLNNYIKPLFRANKVPQTLRTVLELCIKQSSVTKTFDLLQNNYNQPEVNTLLGNKSRSLNDTNNEERTRISRLCSHAHGTRIFQIKNHTDGRGK